MFALALPFFALSLDSTDAAPKAAAPKSALPAESAAEPVAAPEEPELTPEEKFARKHRNIKLNYVASPWSKVLQDVAVAMQTELVADRVPTAKFSRWDMKFYNREEALAILNSELKPLNFRLQLKGHYLVLNALHEFRQEYAPALIRGDHREAVEPPESAIQHAAAEVAADTGSRPPKAAARNPAEPRKLTSARPARAKTIRQAAADEDEEDVEAATEPPAESQKPAVTMIRLKARDALTVSKVIYRAFKAQAELLDDGPRGLQGFLVRRLPASTNAGAARLGKKRPQDQSGESTVRFSIGIDEQKNQLAVEATPDETKAIVKLIKALDVAPLAGQASVRAVTTTKDSDKLASALRPELNRLAVATRTIARQDARRNAVAADDEDAEDEEPEQKTPAPRRSLRGNAGAVDPSAVPQSLKKSLKGEVRVESIPELGILVLIGNDDDVQAVMSVIQEIEKLSTATAPEVKVAFLRHVSSETLAALLTSVYERLGQVRNATVQQSQAISVFPVARPNAILIVASKADLASVYDLIDELDQPSDPASEFRVFRLKYAIPGQVVDKVEALFPPQQAAAGGGAAQQNQVGLVPRVKIIDDLRTNSVIVQARPRDMKEVALLIEKIDVSDSDSVQSIRVFRLEYGVAEEISQTITSAIQAVLAPSRATTVQQTPGQAGPAAQQGGGAAAAQANPELKEVKSAILKFRDIEGPDGRELRSGILADIRMTPDFRTNTITVTAPEESMELVAALVKRFDKPPAAVAEIKIFRLKNSDATAMQNLLSAMFGIQRTGQQGGQQGGGAQPGVPGLLVADAEDSSSMLIPLRFSVDVRTNSIAAVGGAAALNVVESVLLTLDESDIRQRQNEVYKLKNVPALTVAQAISQFLQTQRQVLTQTQDILSPFEQIEREVIVVPETVSNSLLISATPRYFDDIKKLILQLDQSPRQVVIQALFVEVSLDNTDEFGMEVGGQDSILFKRSALATAPTFQTVTTTSPIGVQTSTQTILSETSTPGYLFNGQQLGNNTSNAINPTTVGAQLGTGFATALTNSTLGYPGLLLQAGSQNLNLLLRALSARNRVEVLSRPLIRTVDNQTANIQVGQQVPIVSGFTANATTGVNSPVVQQRQIGIILQVTPRITPDGLVVMEVVARKDSLAATGFPLVTSPTGNVTSPIINTQNALAVVAVPSGQTVILGGMITKSDTVSERKVPMLGDIPVLGNAFRYDLKTATRTELMIFLTPRVIHSDEEAEMIKEIEMGRMNFIESEAERLHGPLHGISVPYDGPTGKNYGFPIPPSTTTEPTDKKGKKVPAPPQPNLPLGPGDGVDDAIPAPGLGGARGASRVQDDDEDLDAAFIQTNYRVPAKKGEAAGRASVGTSSPKAAAAKAKIDAMNASKKPKRNSDED